MLFRSSVSDAGTLADTETLAAAARIIRAVGDGAMTQNELRESVEGATKYKIAALHQLLKNGDLHRDGTGKKGDPYTYSNVKLPGVGEEDEKGGFPVPAIYGELENWKNQNNFMPEAGVARDQQAASDSGFPEPETVTVERPEPGAVEEGDIFVAGANMGIGSSREQAPLHLKLLGIRCVLAKSFSRIFYRNTLNFGVPALICADVDRINPGDTLHVDPLKGQIDNLTIGETLTCAPLPEHLMEMIGDGGLMAHLKKKLTKEA